MKLKNKDIIKEHEGYRSVAYPDPASPKAVAMRAGKHHEGLNGAPWTVGYGHTGPEVVEGYKVTRAQADKDLAKDVATAEKAVSQYVRVPVNQNQFDALVSFVYNVGTGAFKNSTLLRKLNSTDYTGAANELLRWDKAQGKVMNGLTRRREAERELFLS